MCVWLKIMEEAEESKNEGKMRCQLYSEFIAAKCTTVMRPTMTV